MWFFSVLYFKKFNELISLYLNEKERNLLSAGLILQVPTTQRLSLAEAQNQWLNLGLPHESQRTKCLWHPLLPPRVCAGIQSESGLEPGAKALGCAKWASLLLWQIPTPFFRNDFEEFSSSKWIWICLFDIIQGRIQSKLHWIRQFSG